MKGKTFRQIDTEYYLAIMAADLSRAGTKVLLAVIHFTLGYDQRDTAEISHKTFRELTRLSRQAVKAAIRELISCNMIARVRQGSTDWQASVYRINTDISTWAGRVAGEPPEGKPTTPVTASKQGKPTTPVTASKQGKPTTPVNDENLPSTGLVPPRKITHIKKERKHIKKDILSIFDHWNSRNIIKHEKMTAAIQSAIQAALKEYSKEAICLAIKNYGIILHGDFKWSYKWTLAEFLSRGKGNNMERFKDLSVLKENYQRDNRPARNVTYEDVSS